MAIINSYPIGTPKSSDLLVGTSVPLPGTDDDPITKNFPISGIVGLGLSSVTAGVNIAVSPTVGDVVVSAPDAVVNTGDIFPSTPKVTNIVSPTSAQYPPATVDANTLYVII